MDTIGQMIDNFSQGEYLTLRISTAPHPNGLFIKKEKGTDDLDMRNFRRCDQRFDFTKNLTKYTPHITFSRM